MKGKINHHNTKKPRKNISDLLMTLVRLCGLHFILPNLPEPLTRLRSCINFPAIVA